MKHFTTHFLACLLFALMSGGTAKAQEAQEWNYYMTDGTENSTKTGLTSGYYILSVQGIYDEGLLYWADEQQANSNLLISQTKYSEKVNKIIDKTSDDVAFIWYLDVDAEQNTFTIKSVKSGKFLSYTGVSGAAAANVVVPTVESGDVSIASYTINYTHNSQEPGPITIPASTGKQHFIVKLANATYNGSTSAFLHVNGTTDRTTSPHPMFADWHLEHRTGFRRDIDNTPTSSNMYTCAKIAFFKLSEAAAITYNYTINEETVKTEDKAVKIGDSYPAIATMPDFCTATAPSGNVTKDDNNKTKNIEITWSAPFQFSTDIENAHWYHMKFGSAERFVVSTGADQNIPLAETSATHTTASTEQWAFVGNPFDGFKVYNRRKDNAMYGRLVASTTMSPATGTKVGNDTEVTVHYGDLETGTTDTFDALTVTTNVTISSSFFLCQHGETSKKMNWTAGTTTEASTQRIAFWTGGQGNNSAFTVQELALPSLTLIAIDGNTYGTYYIDYPITVPENVSVYTGDVDLTNKRIAMRKATDHIIPAETGVVLVGDNGEATSCTMTANAAAGTLEKGSLTGSLETTTIDTGYNDLYLVFGRNSEGQLGFYKPASSITSIPANKAFIMITGSSVQGLALNFDGGTETGITFNQLFAPEAQSAETVYDLSGRRVSTPAKGCYIRNGKKVYIK